MRNRRNPPADAPCRGLPAALAAAVACALPSPADTTIDSSAKHAYGANIGWINFEADTTNGAVIGEYVCSGSVYSANCGWILLGDGTPANGIRYANDTADDFGVNVIDYACPSPGDHRASLRGFAYGANIGWIHFEDTGDPHLDLSTGELDGHAYGANVGWIDLGEASGVTLATDTLRRGSDSDGDGLADAYEQNRAGDLTTLSASGDADADGSPDRAEYEAATDPLDPASRLRILEVAEATAPSDYELTLTTDPSRVYHIESSAGLGSWNDTGPPFKAAAPQTTKTVTAPGGDNRHFWRAVANLPLQP